MECVDHLRKPLQLTGEALPQLRWILMAFADIKKATSAVNSNIQLAVAVEIHGEFTEGEIRQRQNPLYATGSGYEGLPLHRRCSD